MSWSWVLLVIFACTLYCIVETYCSPLDYIPLDAGPRDELVEGYFWLGFKYLEILAFLIAHHNITLSVRQLKRILRSRHLRRHNAATDLNTVIDVIELELGNTGRDLGYRAMCDRLVKIHKLVVTRETVRKILKYIDPDGVERRKQHRLRRRIYTASGPNSIWHIDGWDKLKTFGFSVHGCIDGYSRRILWLEVGPTNKDPFVIAR